MTYIHAPVRVILQDRNEVRVEIDNSERVVPIPSGAQGLPGEPGFSPIVTVEPITGGNRVTITDEEGDNAFDVMNGQQGEQGEPGEGVPTGGVTGQVLKKRSNTNYDTYWANESGTVLSVNGKTGAVELDASDVGALPDDTFIPTKTSDLTNDSGFITDAGVTSFNGQTGAVTYAAPVQSVNGATGTVVLDADDVGAMSKWDLLWTNASPTSDFAAQTITLPSNDCDFYYIRTIRDKAATTDIISPIFLKVGEKGFVRFEVGSGGIQSGSVITYSREVTMTSATQVAFATGYIFGNTSATRNDLSIPYQIYGIKGVQ